MTTPWSQEYAWAFYTAACILWLIAGVGLFVALFRDRSRGRRRCPKCWYDMTGVPGLKCPECGREARKERRLHTTRRRWRLATLFALLAALGIASFRAPHTFRHGAWALVPVWLLQLVLPYWENDATAEYALRRSATPSIAWGGTPMLQLTSSASDWRDLLAAWQGARVLSNPEAEDEWPNAINVIGGAGANGRVAIEHLSRCSGPNRQESMRVLSMLAAYGVADAYRAIENIATNAADSRDQLLAFNAIMGVFRNKADRSRFLERSLGNRKSDLIRWKSAEFLAFDRTMTQARIASYLAGTDDAIRCGIIEGLAPIGSANRWVLPELLRAVGPEQSATLREVCLVNASKFGPLGPEWHEPVIRHLHDDNPTIRAGAASAAASLTVSPLPKPVVEGLLALSRDANDNVTLAAAKALMARAESFSIPQSQLAWNVLARQEPEAIDEISRRWDLPALLAILETDLRHLRQLAARRLIEKAASESARVDYMLSLLRTDWDPSIRALCAGLLGHTAARDAKITPALVHAGLHDPDHSVRAVALRAAESRRDADSELIAALIDALKDPSPQVVLAAANSLARLGPRAAAAHDALTAVADHPDPITRSAIADAITKTRPN